MSELDTHMVSTPLRPRNIAEVETSSWTMASLIRRMWMWGTPSFPRLARAIYAFALAPIFLLVLLGLAENSMKTTNAIEVVDMVATVPMGEEAMVRSPYGYGMAWGKRGASTATLTTEISDFGDRTKERALYLPRVRRAVQANINGTPLISVGGPSRESDYISFEPHLFIVPPSLETGPQVLTLDLQTRQTQPYVSKVLIGTMEDLRPAYSMRKFFAISVIIAAAAICGLSAVLSFALAIRGTGRYAAISFGALMLSWLIIDVFYMGVTSSWPINMSRALYSSASFVLIVASLNYGNEWTFKIPFVRKWVVPSLAIAFVLKTIPIFFVDGEVYFYILMSADVIAASCVLFLFGLLFTRLARNSDISFFTAVIFIVCILSVVVDVMYAVTTKFGTFLYPDTGITLHYGPIFSALLALTIVAGFVRSFLQAQTVLSNSNQLLSSRLAEREAQIAQVYAEREEEMREAALVDERKRIMRDMHDGVGGKLLSLSLRAKGDGLKPDEMSRELEDSLQELRLIVDSMDTADGDLEMALGALRGRLEPALYEAGIELDWDAGPLGPQLGYGPQQVLSIYRMIQETVTNTIRHADADNIKFKSQVLDTHDIELSIRDDGKGMPTDGLRLGSKGLSNLRSRAAEMGGQVEFSAPRDNGPGLEVIITLPGHADFPPNLGGLGKNAF